MSALSVNEFKQLDLLVFGAPQRAAYSAPLQRLYEWKLRDGGKVTEKVKFFS